MFRWLAKYDSFREQYVRAREAQADVYAAEIIDIADHVRIGEKIEKREVGRRCTTCGRDVRWLRRWVHSEDGSVLCEDGEAEKVTEDRVTTGDMVERARLQIEARKWAAAKLGPKKYGDHMQIDGVAPAHQLNVGTLVIQDLRDTLPAPAQILQIPSKE